MKTDPGGGATTQQPAESTRSGVSRPVTELTGRDLVNHIVQLGNAQAASNQAAQNAARTEALRQMLATTAVDLLPPVPRTVQGSSTPEPTFALDGIERRDPLSLNMGGRLPEYKPKPKEKPEDNPYAGIKGEYVDPKVVQQGVQALQAQTAAANKQAALDAFHSFTNDSQPVRPRQYTYQMTQEEFDALTPDQRAGVLWNAMWAKAIREDLRNQATYEKNGPGEDYQAQLDRMFGPGATSNYLAPAMLDMLDKIGYQKRPDVQLNDFLGLEGAITQDDVNWLAEHIGTPEDGSKLRLEEQLTQTIAQNTKDLGFNPNIQTNPDGSAKDLNTYFQLSFAALNSPETAGPAMGELQQVLTPLELKLFRNYVLTRTQADPQNSRVDSSVLPWLGLDGKAN